MGPENPKAPLHWVLGGHEVTASPTAICDIGDHDRNPFLFKVEKEQVEILAYPNDKMPPDTHNHDPPLYPRLNGPRSYPGPCEGALKPSGMRHK